MLIQTTTLREATPGGVAGGSAVYRRGELQDVSRMRTIDRRRTRFRMAFGGTGASPVQIPLDDCTGEAPVPREESAPDASLHVVFRYIRRCESYDQATPPRRLDRPRCWRPLAS